MNITAVRFGTIPPRTPVQAAPQPKAFTPTQPEASPRFGLNLKRVEKGLRGVLSLGVFLSAMGMAGISKAAPPIKAQEPSTPAEEKSDKGIDEQLDIVEDTLKNLFIPLSDEEIALREELLDQAGWATSVKNLVNLSNRWADEVLAKHKSAEEVKTFKKETKVLLEAAYQEDVSSEDMVMIFTTLMNLSMLQVK